MTVNGPDRTTILLPDGAVDSTYDDAEIATDDAARTQELIAAAREFERDHPDLVPGRPSLTCPGSQSPHVSFRVPAGLSAELDRQSAADGVTRSALARRALAEYLANRRAS
jgi:hypothetical protein